MLNQQDFINYKQEEVLEKVSQIIKNDLENNKNISLSDHYYFNSWADNYGKKKLIQLVNMKQRFTDSLYFNLKLIFRQTAVELQKYFINSNLEDKKNYSNLIVSYCDNNTIKNDKIFDKFFSSSIDDSKDTLWLFINVDSTPKKINHFKNTILFYKAKNNFLFKINFYFLFLKNIILFFLGKENKFFRDNLAEVLKKKLTYILSKYKIKRVIMPFESQPLQHAILKKIKDIDYQIETIGYLHSALPPLPTDFVWKNNEPDVFLVHGEAQKEILISRLGWSKNTVQVANSFRFQKNSREKYINKIYLPYSLGNSDILIKKFEKLFKFDFLNLLPTFEIQNHPFMINSKKHKYLEQKLNYVMSRLTNKNNEKIKNNFSIFFGATASILEVLEHEIVVIHICSEPVFEYHNSKIWTSIKSEQLEPNIFKYELLKKNSIIQFGKKNDFLKKFNIYNN